MREKLASRLGFILLSAGCAIGIGNVWRFPYVTGQSGGGWFVLLYLFFLIALGIPVMVMEFAVGRASALVAVALPLLSLPCVFGFNVWSKFQPFGKGSCVLDLEDFLVSDLLLPLGALAFALYCAHRFGWGWKRFIDEVNAGCGLHFPKGLRIYCGLVLPLVILAVFAVGLVRRFGWFGI